MATGGEVVALEPAAAVSVKQRRRWETSVRDARGREDEGRKGRTLLLLLLCMALPTPFNNPLPCRAA
eukprot:572174-Hanusia_phi.AAC.5